MPLLPVMVHKHIVQLHCHNTVQYNTQYSKIQEVDQVQKYKTVQSQNWLIICDCLSSVPGCKLKN